MADDLGDLSTGEIAQPNNPKLLRMRREVEAAFPHVQPLLACLPEIGSAAVWARRRHLPTGGEIGEVLIRFSGAIESRFGLTREVLLLVSPYADLQFRTYDQVGEVLARLPREVTHHVVMVSSPDPREATKLDDWRTTELLAIPVGAVQGYGQDAARHLIQLLKRRIYLRNVYEVTSPVQDEAFFGRELIVQELLDASNHRRPVQVLGLRKSGKTSLLKHVGSKLMKTRNHAFVLRDLESLPPPPQETVGELVQDLVDELRRTLTQLNESTDAIDALGSQATVSAFRRALKRQVESLSQSSGLTIAFDEVEYLCPPRLLDNEEPACQAITQFFGALRSVVQETDRFTFLLAGLTPAPTERGMLYGMHNPLFSWATVKYVRPFSHQESLDMLQSLGRRMGLRWDRDAIGIAVRVTAGHVFLLRRLGAIVADSLAFEEESRIVTVAHVRDSLPEWRRAVKMNVSESLDHVSRYYPNEILFLERLIQLGEEWTKSERAFASRSLRNLQSLGLVEFNDKIKAVRAANFTRLDKLV